MNIKYHGNTNNDGGNDRLIISRTKEKVTVGKSLFTVGEKTLSKRSVIL